jgi:hypothetical protein
MLIFLFHVIRPVKNVVRRFKCKFAYKFSGPPPRPFWKTFLLVIAYVTRLESSNAGDDG